MNGAYWCVGLEDKIPKGGTSVDTRREFEPTKFEFRKDDYWANRKMSLDELRLDEAASESSGFKIDEPEYRVAIDASVHGFEATAAMER